MTPNGKIYSRKRLGTNASQQRKVAKAISKLVGKVDKSCSTVDTDLAFPGQCVGEPDFALCADRVVECRVCRMLVDMDALELTDCDVFDDAVANGSCGS